MSALIIDGARPVPERFETISRRGAVGATALALELRRDHGLNFREAHRRVGEALRTAQSDDPVAEAAGTFGLAAPAVGQASTMAFGGGPATAAATKRRAKFAELVRACHADLDAYRARWISADRDLEAAINSMINPSEGTRHDNT